MTARALYTSRATTAWPASLYVHVPWCRRRCPYCDFYFVVGRADPRFVSAVKQEIDARASEIAGPLTSVAFGGGTPSVLDGEAVHDIVAHARARFGLVENAEVTLEANPEDLDEDRVQALAAAGVTRMSLGVQSFDDEVLRTLGRGHDGSAAAAAVALACASVPRVSLDLIIGVPSERAERLDDDIARAIALGVGHVSTYILTVEDGTALARQVARGARPPVDDDAQADAYERSRARLVAHGLHQYEISSFARPGEESRHNRIYWGQGVYLGVGPGAHSMRIFDDGSVVRRANPGDLARWLANPTAAVFDVETLTPAAALRETIAFGLRDIGLGIDVDALARRHQSPVPADVTTTIARFVDEGLMTSAPPVVKLSSRGALFADRVARELLSP